MKLFLNLLKKEFCGFQKNESILFLIVLLLIILLSISLKDNPISTCSAVFGLIYTILAGKGKVLCYYFGIIGTLCYSYLSLKNSLYGNLLLYFGYYFPMEIIGIFCWKRHLKDNSREIEKTLLSNKNRIIFVFVNIILSILLGIILKNFDDKYPFLDAFVTVLSVTGMFLTVKRCIEQWIVWTIVNFLSIIIWFLIFLTGGRTFATLLMWVVYLFL